MTFKILKLAAMALPILFLASCNDDDDNSAITPPEAKGNMHIKFEHFWGSSSQVPFDLNTTLVHPASGDTLSFTKLRYYISNVQLQNANGSIWTEEESYHIVDTENPEGGEVEVSLTNIPTGSYTGISYMIGVDSLRNVSGVQEGALDPAEGMFWSWNTGYIFIKAEGERLNNPGTFSYHLGGFSGPFKASTDKFHDFQGATLEITPVDNPSVHLIVNAARFWHGGLSTDALPTMLHMPGEMANTLATNFADGFVFDHVHN